MLPPPWDKLLTSSLSHHLSPSPAEWSRRAGAYIHGNKGPFQQQPLMRGRDGGRAEELEANNTYFCAIVSTSLLSALILPSHLVAPPAHSDLSSPHLIHAAEPSADVWDGSSVDNYIKVSPLVSAEVNGGVRVTVWALTPRSNLIRSLEPQPESQRNLIIST